MTWTEAERLLKEAKRLLAGASIGRTHKKAWQDDTTKWLADLERAQQQDGVKA